MIFFSDLPGFENLEGLTKKKELTKNLKNMKKLVALLAVVALFSCNSTKSKTVSHQVLTDSSYKGKTTESYEVIDNHDDLKKLYDTVEDKLVPNVDFAKSRVVALFMGEKNTGGYAIGIESIRQEKGKVIVKVQKSYPEGMATMAFSQPYMIAKINTTKKIEFEE